MHSYFYFENKLNSTFPALSKTIKSNNPTLNRVNFIHGLSSIYRHIIIVLTRIGFNNEKEIKSFSNQFHMKQYISISEGVGERGAGFLFFLLACIPFSYFFQSVLVGNWFYNVIQLELFFGSVRCAYSFLYYLRRQ